RPSALSLRTWSRRWSVYGPCTRREAFRPWSILPPPLEPGWRQFGIADRMLDIAMPEIVLQAACIPTSISQGEPTGVPQHVRVRLDLEPGDLRSSADELLEVGHGHWRSALGHEQEGRLPLRLTLQSS